MERTRKSLPIHKGKDQTVFKMEAGNSNLIPCLLNTPLFKCSGKYLDRGTVTVWWMCLGTEKNTLLKDILQHSAVLGVIATETLQHF